MDRAVRTVHTAVRRAHMTAKCARCGRPVADLAYLCGTCTTRLERHLGDIPALADDLEVSRTRQSRMGPVGVGVVTHTTPTSLPWDERASRAEKRLRVELVGWVRVVVEERGGRLPVGTLAGMSRHLLASVEWLRHQPSAGEVAGGVGRAVAEVRRVIDRPPPSRFVGICSAVTVVDLLDCDCPCQDAPPCSDCIPAHAQVASACPHDLYVQEGAESVCCPMCGTVHRVDERRAVLLGAVEGVLATVAELVPAVSTLVRPVPASTIRSWVRRKRLVSVGQRKGQAVFRVGDVLDLLGEAS